MLRSGLVTIACAALACEHGPAPRGPLSNQAPAPSSQLLIGQYTCRLDEGGYRYPAFPCAVMMKGARTWLEKTAGSVRLRGWVTRHGDGFSFDGELFCPFGDCTEHVTGEFASTRPGEWRSTMTSTQSGAVIVTVAARDAPVPDGYGVGGHRAYGGDGYGGAGYGGDAYGGGAYGGAGYGVTSPEIEED